MKLGTVGPPNVGKSTLFNFLTKVGAQAANYPFCTVDPNVGAVAMPNARIKTPGEMHRPRKVTPAAIEFVDVAELVRGASKGEGLGNQFLANIREYDAIVHVVCCFEDENVIHVDGSVDPVHDIETINLELIFADLEVLERRIVKTQKSANNGKSLKKELEILKELKVLFEDGKPASAFETGDADVAVLVASLCLLTAKPVIYTANVKEDDLADDGTSNPHVTAVRAYAAAYQSKAFCVSAQIEEEIATFDESERTDYLEALGIPVSGPDKLIAASYELLGLINFLTTSEDETRAWTIKKGSKAPQAAGKVHTDFERDFIRAKVIGYDDFMRCGSSAAVKEKGLMRLEGKDCVIQGGDVILFRFNV